MQLQVTMPDGSKWLIPVMIIAMNRVLFISETEGKTLKEAGMETQELFRESPEAILYWAKEMSWEDVAPFARQIGTLQDYECAWAKADMELIKGMAFENGGFIMGRAS